MLYLRMHDKLEQAQPLWAASWAPVPPRGSRVDMASRTVEVSWPAPGPSSWMPSLQVQRRRRKCARKSSGRVDPRRNRRRAVARRKPTVSYDRFGNTPTLAKMQLTWSKNISEEKCPTLSRRPLPRLFSSAPVPDVPLTPSPFVASERVTYITRWSCRCIKC